MKAYQSQLAKELLADPYTSAQLRAFLVDRIMTDRLWNEAPPKDFILKRANGEEYVLKIVPMA